MKKKLLLFSFMLLLLTACGVGSMISADKNIRKVELGMSKREVVSIMGKDYRVLGATVTDKGPIETIGYDNAYEEVYALTFSEDRLVNYELTRPRKRNQAQGAEHKH